MLYYRYNFIYYDQCLQIIKHLIILYVASDPDKVWNEHIKDYELRKRYSQCMLKLATEIWKGKESRIEWTYQTCL